MTVCAPPTSAKRSRADAVIVRLSSPGRISSGAVSLIGAGILWGTGGITGRGLTDAAHLSGLAVGAYRLGLGGGLLVVVLLVSGHQPPHGGPGWRRIAAVGTLAAVYQGAFFSAVALSSVSLSTLVAIGSSPVFVLLYEACAQRRWPSRRAGLVVLLAIVGLALLVGLPANRSDPGRQFAAAGLAALSGATFAAFVLLGRRPLVGVDHRTVTGYGFLLGGIGLALVAAPLQGMSFRPTADTFGLLVFLAVVPTAIAYTLFFRGLPSVTASSATVIALLEPLTGTLLAIALLGDRLSPAGIVGGVLLGVSIAASIPRVDAVIDLPG
jgi:drug/metabolite transporter, DME family